MKRAVYLYLKGLWWESGGANGRESDQTGWVESQQVVEGGGIYRRESGWDHCCVLGGCLLYLEPRRRGITQKKTYHILNTAKA